MFRATDQPERFPRERWRVVGNRVRMLEMPSKVGMVVDTETYRGMDGQTYCRYFIRWDDDDQETLTATAPHGDLYSHVCSNTSPGIVDE